MNPHTAAAIAQIIFYVPLVPLSIYLLIRNWRYGPRAAWYPAVPFTISMYTSATLWWKQKTPHLLTPITLLVRLTGGILTVIEEQHPGNKGLIIATIIFLNIGLIPLIMSLGGLARLV